MNGVSVIGRLSPSLFADRLGPLNLLLPGSLMCGVLLFAWMGVHNPGGLYAWAIFYGISGGSVQSLFPAALSSLTTDLRKQGERADASCMRRVHVYPVPSLCYRK